MKPFNALRNLFTGNKGVHADNVRELGHHLNSFPTYGGAHDAYENVYASVRPIANRFSAILPYGIDANGKPVEDKAAVNAIYRPNKQMSHTSFLDAIAVGVKTQSEVNILVWHWKGKRAIAGGKIRADNIAGYTFLQGGSTTDVYGNRVFEVQLKDGSMKTYTEDEVITLTDSRNPANLSKGYSPAQAAQRWTIIDDYLADYQSGFFGNGAIPAGMFTIVAPTLAEFKDITRDMKRKHQGADKNNNVAYSYTPVDPSTGKPASTSSITWTPFNVSNRDLELGELFENVNSKIDSAFGVPAIIRGKDDQATYSNAQVSERVFVVNVLKPFVRSIYAQFTHELNRITGGLGYAITADVQVPSVADEEKTEAETKAIEFKLITDAVVAGFSLDSAVDAFKLPTNYKLLKVGDSTQTEIHNDKPQVDEGGEVDSSPSQERETSGGTIAYAKEVKPDFLDSKALSESQQAEVENDVESAARKHMEIQIDAAITATKAVGDPTEEMVEAFANDLLPVLIASMVAAGEIEYLAGLALLESYGLPTAGTDAFMRTRMAVESYRQYLVNVAQSYSHDTALSIRKVLDLANTEELTRAELERRLRNIMQTDEYRVKRLAVTETNYSQQMGSLESMRQIQDETGVLFRKIWNTSGADPCQYCQAMNGTTLTLDDPFVRMGGAVEGVDGGVIVNDFHIREETTLHPNCHCYLSYEVVGATKAVDVDDSDAIYDVDTNRYLGRRLKNGYIALRGLKSNKDTIVKLGGNDG